MVGKPCKRKEQHGYKLYLTIHSSEVKEKTGEELIVPASDEDVENNGRVKVSQLNSESYTGEKEVIIIV